MKVLFKKETDPAFISASMIEKQSTDGCFSPNEIAVYLNIDRDAASINVNKLYEKGLAARIDNDWSIKITGNERWCLINASLTIGKTYEVLAIFGENYLILNDAETKPYGNDPLLFHHSFFKIIDPTKPVFWQCKIDKDGDRYCCLPSWNSPGFFEDYHDGIDEVKKQFWEDLEKYFPTTWKERT
jgi:hypothetical protein